MHARPHEITDNQEYRMKTIKTAVLAAVSTVGMVSIAGAQTQAVVQRPALTATAAHAIGDACIAFAQKNNWRQAITVLNEKGEAIYFFRMDGTSEIGAVTSPIKAKTAFFTRRIGRDVAAFNATFLSQQGLLASPGGIPIRDGDTVVGAVGVGGGVSNNDHACAMAGLEAVGLAPKDVPAAALAAHDPGPPKN
jgi:uncharacterized protein GlcG (DUF336 family)